MSRRRSGGMAGIEVSSGIVGDWFWAKEATLRRCVVTCEGPNAIDRSYSYMHRITPLLSDSRWPGLPSAKLGCCPLTYALDWTIRSLVRLARALNWVVLLGRVGRVACKPGVSGVPRARLGCWARVSHGTYTLIIYRENNFRSGVLCILVGCKWIRP